MKKINEQALPDSMNLLLFHSFSAFISIVILKRPASLNKWNESIMLASEFQI